MLTLPSTLRTVIEKTMPLTVGVFAIMMVQLVDSIFIGMLGINELAVHGITLPFQAAFTGVQVGIGVAATSIISQAVGAQDKRKASSMATLAVGAGMVFIALLCFVLVFFSDWVFHSFISDVSPQQYQLLLAVFNQYWPMWLVSALTVALLYLTTCIYRANGDTKTTGSMFLGASLINLVLDPILIFWFDMGIVGAALASSLGYLICSVYMLVKVRGRGWFGVSDASLEKLTSDALELTKTVIPTTMNQILPSVSAFFTMWLIAHMGTNEMAFWSLLARVESFVLVMSLALTMSIPPMIGHYLGAQQGHTIPELLTASAQFLLIFHIAIALILALTSGVLASALSDEPIIQRWFESTLLFLPFSFAPLGLCMLVASVFNALGVPKKALNVSFARLFIFYVPALWLGASTGEMHYAVVAAACANVLAGGYAWMRLNLYVKANIATQMSEPCRVVLSTDN